MRALFLVLVPCWLLSAAPSGPLRLAPPPERPVPVITAEGQALPDSEMERLARERPLDFVQECLHRYRRNVRGCTLTMSKQERIGGQLQKPELMRVAFRERPFGVALTWLHDAHRAERVLYVEGENDDKMLVRPTPGWRLAARLAGRMGGDGLVAVDVDSDLARQSGRFTLREFGIRNGLARLFADWKAAQEKGALHVEYLGEQSVEQAGGCTCLVLRRRHFLKPERDGVTEQTLYVDKANWLQVGSVARKEGIAGDEGLIGAYFYRDVVLNPPFDPDPFTRAALTGP